MAFYKVAGYIIELSLPDYLIWDNFRFFSCPESKPHIIAKVMSEPMVKIRGRIPDGPETLIRDPRGIHNTYRYGGAAHFFYTPDDAVSYIKTDDSYSEYIFNIEPVYNDMTDDYGTRAQITDAVMIDLRKLLTGRLAFDKGICVHACVINHNGNGIMLSAVSKTGKTTHAHLWQDVFPGTEIINGDNGFCRVLGGVPYVFGSPWCGDSKEFINKNVPVKAIVFLEQAKTNSIEELSALDAFLRLSARCFMPLWDKDLVGKAMDTVEFLTHEVSCYLLKCMPERDAVKVAEHGIFKNR